MNEIKIGRVKMKKRLVILFSCICVCLSCGNVYAGNLSKSDTSKEATINLDSYMKAAGDVNGKVVIYGQKSDTEGSTVLRNKPSKPNAAGGYFWVEWTGDRHYAYFDHATKTHRTSCSNSSATVKGKWASKGYRASSWCYSSLTGNKANWKTK